MEIPLKFRFPAERRRDIDGFLKAKGFGVAAEASRNDTVYFDTPDFALAVAGYSLRVRHIGRAYVQTLKSPAPAGDFAVERFEREWRVSGAAPDLGLLGGTPASPLIASGLPGLRPVFETRIDRTLYPVDLGGQARIELAIDEGEIKAGAAVEPVHELRLELKDGPREALYRFALELQTALPLTIAAESKAGRGLRLRSGQAPGALKARQPSLVPEVTTKEGLRLVIDSCLAQFIANLPALSLAGDGEGVHQARVAIRRLRSALALFDGRLEAAAAARFEAQLRHFGRVFGAARDWDVFVLDTIPGAADDGMERDWLNLLLRPADGLRCEAHMAVSALAASPELTGFVIALAGWIAGELWIESGGRDRDAAAALRDSAPKMFDRLEAKLRKRGRRIRRKSAEELHALRKSLKKLRYAVEFFSGLYPRKAVGRYREACEGVQELLGAINDAFVADALAARIAHDPRNAGLAPSIGMLARWASAKREAALKELPAAWREFGRQSPFWR
jgi:inorganic triphosphatase YgiF